MLRTRGAAGADLDALLELERACYPPRQAYSRAEYRYALEVANSENLLVEDRGAPVAFVGAFVHEGWRAGNVYTLNVHPSRRGRGLATRLMHAVEARLSARGMTRCFLEVNVENAPAMRLYESLGYARVARLRGYYAAYPNPDAWRYERDLRAARGSGSGRFPTPAATPARKASSKGLRSRASA